MNPIMPLWLINMNDDDQPRRPRPPIDWKATLLGWLTGLTFVTLVVAVWFPGQRLGSSIAPYIVDLQGRVIDSTSSGTPSLPPLPDSPFPR